jgi:hypothetical protein
MENNFKADFSVVLPASSSGLFFFNTRIYNVSRVGGKKNESEVASIWCALIDSRDVPLGLIDGNDLLN